MLSDLPEGRRASPAEEDDEEGEAEFRRCVGLDGSDLTITGEAESDEFAMSETARVQSQTTVMTEGDGADPMAKLVDAMASGTAEDCFSDLIAKAVAEGESADKVPIGEVDVGELSFTPPDVEEAHAWQLAIPIEVEDASPTLYLDVVAMREGDTFATVETQDLLQALDLTVRDPLIEAVAGRMSAEGGPATSAPQS